VQDLTYDLLGLLLLGPVAGALDELDALELGAGIGEVLHGAGLLVVAPVLGAGDEGGRALDLPAGEEVEVVLPVGVGRGAVPVEGALEAGAGPLLDEDVEVLVGHPALGLAGVLALHHHLDGLGHGLVEGHDVVVGHLG